MSSVEAKSARTATYPINDLFLNRWSPRALSGEALVDEELLPLFEAARWAPSAYNSQPWRFVIAKRDTPEWKTLFGLLAEFNQAWCKNAAALVVVLSSNNFEYNGKPSPTHSFDTGSAWISLALEASSRGLVAHGMSGFDYDRARTELKVPGDYSVEAMIAIGKKGNVSDLSEDLQKMEAPSDRKPLTDLLFKGGFGAKYN